MSDIIKGPYPVIYEKGLGYGPVVTYLLFIIRCNSFILHILQNPICAGLRREAGSQRNRGCNGQQL